MRSLHTPLLAAVVALLAAPAAGAHVLHTVAAGETLWSIAAQSNLTTRTVAAYNGLSPDANVVLGSTLKIPSVAEGAAALAAAGAAPATSSGATPRSRPPPPRRTARGRLRDGRLDARRRAADRRAPTSCAPATRSARSPRRPASASRRWRR